ncbi:hypothetical protein E1292_24055 [Nonomuraea deserti]|uniref:Proline-rich protein n=1 Tax=Nonomuraea deserti TaxID=1848322 RepID=A0A4V2YA38_9ACTN|nr:hypothetical protein [Nonomuraea deserti]TDD02216.1 hypothetical protein E1292_24055 [Nonomuraea deserti]
MTPEEYAQAVRDALADHPEREELLDDLDGHLAEIAAESGLPLEDRLGPPAAYADELAAAYGERPERRRGRRRGPREQAVRAHAFLMGYTPYRSLVGFLPELRPGWWVLRGYVLAMVLVSMAGDSGLAPATAADWAVAVACVLASVWFGRRRRGRLVVLLAVAANTVAGVAVFATMVAQPPSPAPDSVYMAEPAWVRNASSDGVYNIKPYAKDGTPLTDVYLYDQDGNPLTTDPERYGYTVDRSCGEPILNRYPLPLARENFSRTGPPSPSPSCADPAPSASPSAADREPTPGATPSPEATR